MPRVSIGLPVYNGEKYLSRTIDSIRSQTYENFELIISDNASADRTEEICREYAERDARIRYYRNEKNVGAAKNFNRVFELSHGDYFKWIAADDEIKPDFLAKCVDVLDNNPSIVLACSRYVTIDEHGNIIKKLNYDHNLRSARAYQRFRQLVRETMGSEHPVWGVIRSNVLRETHLIRPIIGCDSYLAVELALKGEFGQVREYLNCLRIHPEAYSTNFRRENVELDGMQGPREARWLNPENKGRFFLPHWRLLWEYFLLVVRSKEMATAKCFMVAYLFYPLVIRWGTILTKELFFAVGMGKAYLKMKAVIKGRAVQRGKTSIIARQK